MANNIDEVYLLQALGVFYASLKLVLVDRNVLFVDFYFCNVIDQICVTTL